MTINATSTVIALMSEQSSDGLAWVHLIPSGTFQGKDGRGPYTLQNADAVITATRAYHGRSKMMIDYEHQSHRSEHNGQPAPAAGWIVGLQSRADGIWGLVEWTEEAAARIAKREYRYLSPAFTHSPGPHSQAVGIISDAALVNKPNLDQLTALNRAEASMDQDELAAKLAAARAALGLPETATQEDIMAKLKGFLAMAKDLAGLTGEPPIAQQSAVPDPAKFVPIGDFERVVADANRMRQGISQHAAEAHVTQTIREGRLPGFLRDWGITLCTQNTPAFDAFVKKTGPSVHRLLEPSHTAQPFSLHNDSGKSGLSESELAICSHMGLTPEEFTKARGTAGINLE